MRTTVGVAEARAQLSEIISQAVNDGTVTVIERYGKPAVAVVPINVLDALPPEAGPPLTEPADSTTTIPMTPRDRNRRLIAALREVVEISKRMTPEESEEVYQAFDAPYQESRGRHLER